MKMTPFPLGVGRARPPQKYSLWTPGKSATKKKIYCFGDFKVLKTDSHITFTYFVPMCLLQYNPKLLK